MEPTSILIKPVISEKSLNQASAGWYTFMVKLMASKPQIKQAVEKTFRVKVLTIKTMVVKGKTRRVGRRLRQVITSSWKKAVVLLPKDQKIDLFEVPGGEAATTTENKEKKK